MYPLLMVLHLVVCFGLIGVVLLQSGKGGGLAGGAFGGSAQTVFGGRGATDFITRATMVLGGLFFLTSLSLALLSSGGLGGRSTARSLVQEEAKKSAASAPSQLPPGGAPAGGTPASGMTPATGTTTPATGTTPSGAGTAPTGGTKPPGGK